MRRIYKLGNWKGKPTLLAWSVVCRYCGGKAHLQIVLSKGHRLLWEHKSASRPAYLLILPNILGVYHKFSVTMLKMNLGQFCYAQRTAGSFFSLIMILHLSLK